MPTVLITGCDHGIGAEFARQYAAAGWRVHATCLNPATARALDGLAPTATITELDVTDAAGMRALADTLRGEPIDLLLGNAALSGDLLGGHNPPIGQIDYGVWARMFAVNTMAAMRLMEAFLPHVEQSRKRMIAFISSRMGSITFNKVGGSYAYRSSKAALNAVAKSLAIDLRPRGVTAIVLHPGMAKTYAHGRVEVAESVAGMRRVLARSGLEDTGSFYMFNDQALPW